jgi:AbrB family looped-hinge helix DNA binding protein
MAAPFIAKVTSKGQITIPKALRETIGLQDGDYVLLYPQGEGVRFERAALSPAARFEALAVRTEARFAAEGITAKDVEEAIRWARQGSASSSTPTS